MCILSSRNNCWQESVLTEGCLLNQLARYTSQHAIQCLCERSVVGKDVRGGGKGGWGQNKAIGLLIMSLVNKF